LKKEEVKTPDNLMLSEDAHKHRNSCRFTKQSASTPKAPRFTGRCDDLDGYIYDVSSPRQAADTFTKTTREVAEYVGQTYKYGADAQLAIEKLAPPIIAEPDDPEENASGTINRIWEKDVNKYVKRKNMLSENLKTAYSLVYGQCTDALRAKLEAQPGHSAEASDVIALLKSIKTVMFSFQAQKYAPRALCEAKRRFYSMRQGKDSTCQQYLETYQNCIDVITFCGGKIGTDNGLVDNALRPLMRGNATAAQLAAANNFSKNAYIAVGFILGADPARYGKLLEDLENDHTQKQDRFPKTLDEAYSLLVHWKQNPRNMARGLGSSNDGVSFTNVGEDDDDGGAKSHRTSKPAWKKGQARGTTPLEFIRCFRCEKKTTTQMSVPTPTLRPQPGRPKRVE